MRGTEKQIAWAKDIQIATLSAIDALIDEGQKYKGNPKADALLVKLAAQREAVANCEYAGDLIECFRLVGDRDDIKERCRAFAAACKVTYANTPAQCAMLGK